MPAERPQPTGIIDVLAARTAAMTAMAEYRRLLLERQDESEDGVARQFTVRPMAGVFVGPLIAERVLWRAGDRKKLGQIPVTRDDPFEAVSFGGDPSSYDFGSERHIEFEGESEEHEDGSIIFSRLPLSFIQLMRVEISESRDGVPLPYKWLGGSIVTAATEHIPTEN